ncbi:hypothetical protein ABW20_dc0103356 [Dactylellina cionopaga]|nr:hypothetical protein ABW20_dc0103356 [Dactylellina cionopaga]
MSELDTQGWQPVRGGKSRGRGHGRGTNSRGNHQKPTSSNPAPEVYGIDPEDLREMQELAKRNGETPSIGSTSTSSKHQFHQQDFRGNHNKRGKMPQQTAHNRPALKIAGNPEKPKTSPMPNGSTKPQPNYDKTSGIDESGEMNAHLSERLVFSKRPTEKSSGHSNFSGVFRNPLVEVFERAKPLDIEGINHKWRAYPDVPSAAELMSEDVELPCNEVGYPWDSVDEYLGAHYELLREDSFSPLRDAVGRFRAEPQMDDENDVAVYENCRIIGVTFANNFGICVKMNFSTNRARKKIRWEHSKRLCPGTLVALTTDDFSKVVRVATVAARPLSGVDDLLPNGPEVDLLLAPDELEIDPTKTWIMIESRKSYFEAYKHTLRALQRMETDFPLHQILTLRNPRLGAPQFLEDQPKLNMTACFNDHPDVSTLKDVNVLRQFPSKKNVTTSMDESQLEAVQRIITKELAIVQGPPGCGKTFVSVKALAVMIANNTPNDPPIIVACQTNHALDQLLRYVLDFEPNIIRLGGRTQDQDEIKKRTLYNTRLNADRFEVQGSKYGVCRMALRRIEMKGKELLDLLSEGNMTPDALLKFGIITQAQRDSFHAVSEQWVGVSTGGGETAVSPMKAWVGDYLIPITRREDMVLDFEEEDIGVEDLKDREAEFDEEYDGRLRGWWVEFRRQNEVATRVGITEDFMQQVMKKSDVWEIPEGVRPNVYARFERAFMAAVEKQMRALNKEYAVMVAEYKIARWERDAHLLSRAKLIGMTTTGVSKYRSLVASLQPRICLIEEAAETLEGPLIAACYPSIQQLILVGDHKQLKGHCNVSELEEAPYNLAISMFERLVSNGIGYTMLIKQRRMRPEIRQILMPIYPNLEDDIQVLNKPSVPGMGNTNLYFYAHQVPEEQDELSKKNTHEAQMVVKFCNYLFENGIKQSEITILTFYTGQVRELHKLLRQHQRLNIGPDRVRVATVDSFQGEENEVVVLSLCRSNQSNSIGFLSIPNRVCVALSRAKRGFYMFGNAGLLTHVSALWWDILQIMNARYFSTTLEGSC